MGQVRKIKAGLVKISVNDFVGEDGNIFFDVEDGVFRLSDGATPGGIPLATGSAEGGASTFRQLLDTPSSFSGAGGTFVKVNAQASALEFVDVDLFDGDYNSLSNLPTLFNPGSITASLIPQTDIAIDLGSAAKKWRDLYLSGNTIYLGNAVIRNIDGTVELPANAKINGKKIPLDVSELDDTNGLLNGTGGGVTSYNELTDLPTLFSGNYNDLTNKPTIPTVPTTISSFTNDAGYLTSIGTISYNDLADTPTIPSDISELTDNTNLLAGAGGDGSYVLPIATNNTLGGIKIGSGLSINGSGVVSVTAAGVTSYNDLTDTPDLTVYQLAINAFSGSYNDLTDTPVIPTVPTTISSFTNDSGYITGYTVIQTDVTQHQAALSITESQISDLKTYLTSVAFADLTTTPTTLLGYGITDAATSTQGAKADTALQPNTSFDVKGSVFGDDSTLLVDAVRGVIPFTVLDGKPSTLSGYGITDAYTTTQVDSAITSAINQILGDAPALLDTLGEIADAVGDDANFITTINTAINLKADSANLAIVATSGSYTDLSNTPIIPTDISELTDSNGIIRGSNITEDDLITYSILFG